MKGGKYIYPFDGLRVTAKQPPSTPLQGTKAVVSPSGNFMPALYFSIDFVPRLERDFDKEGTMLAAHWLHAQWRAWPGGPQK
jgi:hypothetical protein